MKDKEGNVSFARKIAYSSNQFGINILWQAFNTIAVFYYVTQVKVSGTVLSDGMIVYGIVNAFLNVMAGYLSDRTHTRFGRRIPYIAFMSLPLCLAFVLLFTPMTTNAYWATFYFFVLVFLFDFFFTFVALNMGALYPEMYRSLKDRSNVSAWQQLFGILGMIIGVALVKSLGQTLGYPMMALAFATIGGLTLYVSLWGSFEDKSYQTSPFDWKDAFVETFSNRKFLRFITANFMIQLATTMFTTLSSYFTQYVVIMNGITGSLFLGSIFIVAIPMSFIWAKIAQRIATSVLTMVSAILFVIDNLFFLVVRTPMEVIITGAVMGIPIAGFMVLLNILLADVIDEDERHTHRRREGMYYGVNGFLVRLGMSVQYAIMAIYFWSSGFNSHLSVQGSSAILGIRLMMGLLPIVFMGFATFALLRYRSVRSERRAAALSKSS
nr:MFS transporter [Bacilli bacterium]